MEHDNPSTEIRFRCEEPYQMRGKTSDETDVDDYTCNPFAGKVLYTNRPHFI